MRGIFQFILITIILKLTIALSFAQARTCNLLFKKSVNDRSVLKFFDYKTERIFYSYKEHKKPKGTIVILHGLGETSKSLEQFANLLKKKGYSILTLDLLGHGETLYQFAKDQRIPHRVPIESQAEMVLKLLTHLKIRNFHVIGHSYGGGVALKLATLAGRRTQSLTLMATLMEKLDNYYLDPLKNIDNIYTSWLKAYLKANPFLNFWLDPIIEVYLYDALKKHYSQKFPDNETLAKLHTEATLAVTRGIGNFNALTVFSEVHKSTRVLIVNSKDDMLSPEKLNDQLFFKLNAQGYLVTIVTLEKTDHNFPIVDPATTTEVVLPIIRGD